jgi:hypothetical protein
MKHRFASRHLELDAGESLFFHSKAGSALISTSGTLLVTGAPRWLGEQVVCHATRCWRPGQAHTVNQDGWITVTAQHGGAACIVRQPARFRCGSAGGGRRGWFLTAFQESPWPRAADTAAQTSLKPAR